MAASTFFRLQNLCVVLLVLLTCAPLALASRTLQRPTVKRTPSLKDMHEEWILKYGRNYKDNAEKQRRFQIFKTNVEFIDSYNKNLGRSYVLSLNVFADQTNEEFVANRNGYKKQIKPKASTLSRYENATDLPSAIDWRAKGAVTPIKDQGQFGCCWAFSAVAAVEGVNQISTGKLISLSEQEVVDCDTDGPFMDDAFKFILKNKGITAEETYPYVGIGGTCNKSKEASSVASINGYKDVPTNSETDLLRAVAFCPVSVAIDASGAPFQFYAGGVFVGPCGTNLDHAVTVVGYGTTSDGTKYWLVKNSWGTSWGEDGYIRIKRESDTPQGLCGIAMEASYPTTS